ncbi:MAG: hypothetical protein V7647_252 [Acidobacteriota bacterium]
MRLDDRAGGRKRQQQAEIETQRCNWTQPIVSGARVQEQCPDSTSDSWYPTRPYMQRESGPVSRPIYRASSQEPLIKPSRSIAVISLHQGWRCLEAASPGVASRCVYPGEEYMKRVLVLFVLTGAVSLMASTVASAEPAMCLGTPATITGSGTIVGTDGPDVIVGSTGNDTILGLGGDDLICGDLGNDTIDGGSGDDFLIGDSSLSILLGQNGGQSVPGGNDTIYGGAGDDQIFGEAGSDTIDTGNGNDFATGNVGNDTVSGGNGDDELFGGPGSDTLNGENGNDLLVGTVGSDVLNGGKGDDLLDGDLPPADESGQPVLDPNPNFDTCNGDQGFDMAFGCESMSGIESLFGS